MDAHTGYLLARADGEAEAVLEHVQPFFYECVRMHAPALPPSRLVPALHYASNTNLVRLMARRRSTYLLAHHRWLVPPSHATRAHRDSIDSSLGVGSGTPHTGHSGGMMQATAELDGSVDGRSPIPALGKGAMRSHARVPACMAGRPIIIMGSVGGDDRLIPLTPLITPFDSSQPSPSEHPPLPDRAGGAHARRGAVPLVSKPTDPSVHTMSMQCND